MRRHFLLPLFMSLLLPLAAPLQRVAAKAPELGGIAFQQKPGSELPGTVAIRDAPGRVLRFADLFAGNPLILVLGYFHCANLCGVIRESLFRALTQSGLLAGRDYSLAVLSIDPSETSAQAAAAKADDIERHAVPGAAENLHLALAWLRGTHEILAPPGVGQRCGKRLLDAGAASFRHRDPLARLWPHLSLCFQIQRRQRHRPRQGDEEDLAARGSMDHCHAASFLRALHLGRGSLCPPVPSARQCAQSLCRRKTMDVEGRARRRPAGDQYAPCPSRPPGPACHDVGGCHPRLFGARF